jgi:hypothetical protein
MLSRAALRTLPGMFVIHHAHLINQAGRTEATLQAGEHNASAPSGRPVA